LVFRALLTAQTVNKVDASVGYLQGLDIKK